MSREIWLEKDAWRPDTLSASIRFDLRPPHTPPVFFFSQLAVYPAGINARYERHRDAYPDDGKDGAYLYLLASFCRVDPVLPCTEYVSCFFFVLLGKRTTFFACTKLLPAWMHQPP